MEELLDLKDSKLVLEGNKILQKKWNKKIGTYSRNLDTDKSERVNAYRKRRDFYTGNQGQYSNIVGVIQDTKNKKGHTNQVVNYAGKTVVKIAFGLANNPPSFIVNSLDMNDGLENANAESVEKFIDSVLKDKKNRFFKKTYRRASFNQAEFGDAAIKVYPKDGKICIVQHDDMTTIKVGWNGNPGEYDFVIAENYKTADSIEDDYGIKVNKRALEKIAPRNEDFSQGSWNGNNQWGTKNTERSGQSKPPSGKNELPKVKVEEFDSEEVYAIRIEGELVQLIFKDDKDFPKMKFWIIVHNIPNPPSPWSIADIDYLVDAQIELNENDNRSSDHLRVGNVQRYVAYNMTDFDPESIKTSSGQVIFVNDPEGKSRFEPLQTNINNFPDDQYNQRKLAQIYDMGLPKVNYGSSGADSGRSKAIDYQSSVDLTTFKRDAWELALQDLFEKIQILGNFLYGDKVDWFNDQEGNFAVREAEFDWADALPLSQSDKIVNVANKFNMIGISLRQAYKELGYRDPDGMIKELKNELKDPDLMILRSKMWNFSQGILVAQNQAAMAAQSNGSTEPPPAGGGNQPSATLTSEQNSGNAQPMAAKGGTTAVSTAAGSIAQANQNRNAQTG